MGTAGLRLRGAMAVLAVLLLGATASACKTKNDAAPTDNNAPSTTAPVPAQSFGSSAGPADASKPTDGGNLVFGIEAEPEGLDPTRYAFSSAGHFVASVVFDPLATVDANGKAVPYLAQAIDPSDGYKTWTLTIPSGITFHNGEALNAQVVVDNLEAYRKSYITAGDLITVTSVTAPDATHVVIKLSEPFVNLPVMFAMRQTGYIIAPAMLKDPELANKPIGTGPFSFVGHEKDKFWSFKKNPTYRQPGLPHLDAIDIRPMPDDSQRVQALKSGDIDMLTNRGGRELVDLRATDVKRVENSIEKDFITLNTQEPPFNYPVARQAVAYATDTDRYRKEIYLDTAQPADGLFSPSQTGYLDDTGYPKYDPAKAKQLVDQYRQQTGKDLEFTFVTQADMNVQAESQLLQSGYEGAGMKVTVKAFPQINLIAQIATGSYQMGRFRLFGAPNPDADSSFWRSTSVLPPPGISTNFPRFADPKIDELIKTAVGSTDEKVRTDSYQEINRIMGQNQPYIWLARPTWILAANTRVNGIYAAANGTVQTIGPKTWMASLFITK